MLITFDFWGEKGGAGAGEKGLETGSWKTEVGSFPRGAT